MAKKRTREHPHVRMYWYELNSQAYRHLDNNARALLVEFRALYSGGENRVFLSVREAAKRINTTPKTAAKALAQLVQHGFIREIEKGSFNRKVKHATVYALTNHPIHDNGREAPKDYMRWEPPNG